MSKFSIYLILFLLFFQAEVTKSEKCSQPQISFTFDDGSLKDYCGFQNSEWNKKLLNTLEQHELKVVLFVSGKKLNNESGRSLISSWDANGHLIGNHSYSHYYFNNREISLEDFIADVQKNDSLISNYTNYTKLFRFPYLKEGNTIMKRDGFRKFLSEFDYMNGYVTIDASDWYIDSRLNNALKNGNADLIKFRDFYINHLIDRANYYDSLGLVLTGRRIKHNILLHHNLVAALFIGDLITEFENKGWKIINAEEAYSDSIYNRQPDILPAGESLIWALAKESKIQKFTLRYPAEDSKYIKKDMDSLGL
jgi:peptidoglycan-N-acetylglucosamine deacetylase